ncbi:polyprotein, partial [Pleione virus Y]
GNNSGQPSTVVDNSLMVIIAVIYSLLMNKVDVAHYEDFFRFFVNGDDLLIAIEPTRVEMLSNFSKHFLTLGLNYDFNNIVTKREDVSYMSHVALERNGIYIPKLDRARIVSILQWDKSTETQHRAEAICAALIEAWGYDDLVYEIRCFYHWLITTNTEFIELKARGLTPYLSELATEYLYTCKPVLEDDIFRYTSFRDEEFEDSEVVFHQSDVQEIDAGSETTPSSGKSDKGKEIVQKDRDIDAGTKGPPMERYRNKMAWKMRLPQVRGKTVIDVEALLKYKPDQADLSNKFASHEQFDKWHSAVQEAFEVNDEEMRKIMNGLMVWCLENGTSPNLNQPLRIMIDGQQVEYPIRPIIENAQPSFRQIMAHFSDSAVAYIEMRNATEPYMPRYGLERNLKARELARVAFDFFQVTSRTSARDREAHFQMKAAALVNTKSQMFGLDGNVGTQEEDTERHVAADVNRNMHTLLGMRQL